MSRQRDRIRRTAVKWGTKIERLEWEPIGAAAEKCGPSGGWIVELDDGEIMMSYHHEGICEMIKNHTKYGASLYDEDIERLKKLGLEKYNDQ